ncbi:unnamed protein product [Sphagnum tenellum]
MSAWNFWRPKQADFDPFAHLFALSCLALSALFALASRISYLKHVHERDKRALGGVVDGGGAGGPQGEPEKAARDNASDPETSKRQDERSPEEKALKKLRFTPLRPSNLKLTFYDYESPARKRKDNVVPDVKKCNCTILVGAWLWLRYGLAGRFPSGLATKGNFQAARLHGCNLAGAGVESGTAWNMGRKWDFNFQSFKKPSNGFLFYFLEILRTVWLIGFGKCQRDRRSLLRHVQVQSTVLQSPARPRRRRRPGGRRRVDRVKQMVVAAKLGGLLPDHLHARLVLPGGRQPGSQLLRRFLSDLLGLGGARLHDGLHRAHRFRLRRLQADLGRRQL